MKNFINDMIGQLWTLLGMFVAWIVLDGTAGAFTVTLPDPSGLSGKHWVFLKTSDYLSIIQTVDLNQITENNPQNLYDSEVKAISRMRTKLVQRYMVDIELGTMTAYSAATHYRTRDRVIAGEVITHVNDFNRWDNKTEYSTSDIVTDTNGYVYTAIAASTNQPLTNTTYWAKMINLPTSNATYWTAGDNRYPMFVELAMDMTLYTITPQL